MWWCFEMPDRDDNIVLLLSSDGLPGKEIKIGKNAIVHLKWDSGLFP